VKQLTAAPIALLLFAFSVAPGFAQTDAAFAKAVELWSGYRVTTNVIYQTASGWNGTLDVYRPVKETPNPTLVFFHGGGFRGGDTVSWQGGTGLIFLPFLEMGWTVVSVDYRPFQIAHAPAAVEDCLCAVRWLIRNAKEYNIDPTRIVTAGQSVGGLLALTAGMIPASAGLDRQCPGNEPIEVAGMISFGGMADVTTMLDGPGSRTYVVSWFGSDANRAETAKRVSPITYVRPGLPPILIVHGDEDQTALYAPMVQLHEALTAAGSPSELHTVVGGGHSYYNYEDSLKIFASVRSFLDKHNLSPK